MEELKLFQSPIFGQVRTVVINGQVMFVATDVAKCLGYSNPNDAVIRHCKSDGVAFYEGVVKTGQRKDGTTYEQTGEIKVITKGNLVRLVASSELPQAEEVESWIFDEVIPTVLETGGYIATKQDNTPEEIMARALIVAQETIKRKEERLKQLEEKNAKLKPKADFAEAAFKAEGKVDIGQAAKILNLGFGRNTLFKKLREADVFFKDRNEPKQKYIDAGYFEMTLLPPIHRDSHPDILYQKVLCKPKGLAYINYLFGGKPSDGKTAKIK